MGSGNEVEPEFEIAERICLEAGALTNCPECGHGPLNRTMGREDAAPAYALATRLWTSGKYRNVFPELKDIREAVEMALAAYPDECPVCRVPD